MKNTVPKRAADNSIFSSPYLGPHLKALCCSTVKMHCSESQENRSQTPECTDYILLFPSNNTEN